MAFHPGKTIEHRERQRDGGAAVDLNTMKHVGRLRSIIVVLLKYGFDDVVERLEIPGKLLLQKVAKARVETSHAERLRLALEELGPTFVKFGQILGMRPDLLPQDLVAELRRLHDEVRPIAFADVRRQIERTLDRPLDDVFIQFDEAPVAAASLAQVHRAVLRVSREPVAVKVQRPDVSGDIDSDIAIMELLAGQLHRKMEAAVVYDLPGLVEDFKRTIHRELDYRREARHMRIFRANFADDPNVNVPRLHEGYCTGELLVMELVDGVKLDEAAPDDEALRRDLARRGLRIVVKQILEDGFFHADPHPGNLVVRPDGSLCMLDCGMVGRLTREMRFRLTDLIHAAVNKDSERLLDVLLELTRTPGAGRVNRQELQRDLLDLLDGYHSLPLQQLDVGGLLTEITDVLCEHRLILPRNLAFMIKALVMAEGIARKLDPELNVIAEIEPQVRQLTLEQWKPENIWRGLRGSISRLWALQQELPRRVGLISEKLESGKLAIQFRHENLDDLQQTISNAGSRLTVGIIIAAMVIGSSLIITAGVGPSLFGFPVLGLAGYVISAIFGLWVVFNVIRSNW